MKGILSKGNKVIAVLIILVTILAVFVPIFDFTIALQDYLVHFLLFLVLSGLIGLVINDKTILYTSFACAGALAIFLKNASNSELKNPQINNLHKITVAHINLSLITDVETVINVINDQTVDLISFQEYTPDWANIIPIIIKEKFPYNYQDVRIDLYGKGVFSKYTIRKSQLIKYIDIPNIETEIEANNEIFTIFSTYMTPALEPNSKAIAKSQFQSLTTYISKVKKNKVLIGEFNQVYWSHDIIEFRNKTELLNSRRNVFPTTFRMPYDHIFYSSDMECYYFEELNDTSGTHIGCKASFQIKENIIHYYNKK